VVKRFRIANPFALSKPRKPVLSFVEGGCVEG
jgi:hypothetical protein